MGFIQLSDLKVGDVLLFHSETLIPSRAIQFFDNSDWNHSGLFWGDSEGNPYNVAESVAGGVGVHTFQKSKDDNNRILVRRLKENVPIIDPVIEKARSYLGNPYGYHDMVLLAMICLVRRVSINSAFDLLLRRVLNQAAVKIDELLAKKLKKQPMICSSFVFRSYNEALPEPDDRYTIRIAQESGSPSMHTFAAHARSTIGGYEITIDGSADKMRGPGIHPKSVLAQVLQTPNPPEPVRGSFRSQSVEASFADAGQQLLKTDPSEQIQTFFEEYKKLLRTSSPAETEDQQISGELRSSLESFAEKFYSADTQSKRSETPDALMRRVTFLDHRRFPFQTIESHPDPVKYLVSSAANFVTPGDLYRTQDLYTVGELDPKILANPS